MDKLYENIKNRRIELKITQSELAAKVGYADKGMISRIENGKINLSQGQLYKFAEALETTPSALMGWSEEKGGGYYTSEETAKKAQELFENEEMRLLFDAAKDCKPEDLQMAADLLRRLKGTNPND